MTYEPVESYLLRRKLQDGVDAKEQFDRALGVSVWAAFSIPCPVCKAPKNYLCNAVEKNLIIHYMRIETFSSLKQIGKV